MISIVVPTMWKFKPFVQFLIDLCNYSSIVDEIILIDNHPSEAEKQKYVQELMPYENKHRLDEDYQKIKWIKNDRNVGVNPAWNAGVKLAKNDVVCIMNDDVIFDSKIFYKVLDHYQADKDTGAIGICPGKIEFDQPAITDGNGLITPLIGNSFGFGSLFFVKKSRWIDIPSDLVIYYGDNWVLDTHMIRGYKNCWITNSFFYTPYAQTCKDIPDSGTILEKERELYMVDIARYYASEGYKGFIQAEYRKACNNIHTDIYYHLPLLRTLADECESVVELGVRSGESTRAFLSSKAKSVTSYDVVEDYDVKIISEHAKNAGVDFNYVMENVLQADIPECDFLFIDSEHTAAQLTQELYLHADKANKYIGFHDTHDPYGAVLLPVIMKFLSEKAEWAVKYHSTECHGLTILERIC